MDLKQKRNMQDIIRILDFNDLIRHYGLFDNEVLGLLEVDKRTLTRWIKNNSAPVWARKLVVIHGRGYLPPEQDWFDFSIGRDGKLYTPFKNFVLSPHDIMAWW